MHDYLFVHTDGRQGRGETTWRAILDAVGHEEAYSYNDIQPTRWEDNITDHEEYPRKTTLLCGDEVKGTIYERRRA